MPSYGQLTGGGLEVCRRARPSGGRRGRVMKQGTQLSTSENHGCALDPKITLAND